MNFLYAFISLCVALWLMRTDVKDKEEGHAFGEYASMAGFAFIVVIYFMVKAFK